jgi:hypothetical protein
MYDFNVFDRFGNLVGQCNYLPTAEQLAKCYPNGSVVCVDRGTPPTITLFDALLVAVGELAT